MKPTLKLQMKPKHKRLLIVLASLISIFAGTFILLNNFRDNLIYFYPPADIAAMPADKLQKLVKKQVRVGGMVKEGSLRKSGELDYNFTLTDFKNDLEVSYHGLLPPMFREGQGVVAQGNLVENDGKASFTAKQLITKHDEKYMPPEISRSLKVEKKN